MFSGHIPLARWNVIVWVIVVCLQAGTISSRGVQFHFHGHQGNVGQFSLATTIFISDHCLVVLGLHAFSILQFVVCFEALFLVIVTCIKSELMMIHFEEQAFYFLPDLSRKLQHTCRHVGEHWFGERLICFACYSQSTHLFIWFHENTALQNPEFHFLIYTVSVKHITEHMYRLMCLKTWNSSLLLCLIMFEMSTFIIRHWWKDMDGHQWTPWVYFQLRITYIFYIFLILCLCGQ